MTDDRPSIAPADAAPADATAAIDWAARWRALIAGRDAQRGESGGDGDPGRDPWRGRAERFATYSDGLPDDDPLWRRLRAAVRPDDTVLDIGAGAGRYALPLARLARQVVAVEPSPAMRRHLEARIAGAGVENIIVVPATWPEAGDGLAPAEVSVCAHVLYGVREIAPFLRALDRLTTRLALIAIRVDQHPGLLPLAREVFGEERVRQPALLDLYNALAAVGIIADVQVGPPSDSFRFPDHEDAVAHYRDRLRVAPGSPTEARLRAILAARLIREPDGRWRWPERPPRNAIVSWEK